MRFSLVTICKNSQRTLGRTIESVLAQKTLPDEYIFVDGNSTDRTQDIIDEYVPRLGDKGVKAISLKQVDAPGEAGIPVAWNQGIKTATGDVIALLNSDDWYEPMALESVATAFQQSPDAGVVSAPVNFLDQAGKVVSTSFPKCLCFLPILMPVPHPGLFVKKSTYDRLGLYDTSYRISADYDFVWRLAKNKVEFAYIKEPQVNMELGGLANANRKPARDETRNIATKHQPYNPIPYIAWIARTILNR